MEFIADLHIHSRHSRATSSDCCPEKLDLWARRKGIRLLGTGDFTHRSWRKELEEKLVATGNGFYALKPHLREKGDFPDADVQFVISGEISCIYKKNGRTRKVHNVIMLPSIEAAEKLSVRLETVGNLHCDGRPILGLDCKTLLDMTLSVCAGAIFIPAHIWTPHFSVLGANSGFDSIDECFGDLTESIYAVETGLSSDPPMNMRLSSLDRFALVSNSDAHSPSNLGREANVFDTDITYEALYSALKTNDRKAFPGTVEFYPEEGKYHFDGHRACNIQWEPAKTIAAGGVCPVCGKRLTVGVLHRVEVLADRPEGFTIKDGRSFVRMTTLQHIIAASLGCGAASRRVAARYDEMLTKLGPELSILRSASIDDIKSAAGELVAEGVRRMRDGELRISPGFDGEYGIIEIFSDAERMEFLGQAALFETTFTQCSTGRRKQAVKKNSTPAEAAALSGKRETLSLELNEPQQRAVMSGGGAILVTAGPGTGKTRTLVGRIVHLVAEQNVDPRTITAVTFTNKAAGEIKERLAQQLPPQAINALTVGTFHAICLTLLREMSPPESPPVVIDHNSASVIIGDLVRELSLPRKPSAVMRDISRAKALTRPVNQSLDAETYTLYEAYQGKLASFGALDFDDLLLRALEAPFRPGIPAAASYGRFGHLLIDEFQDINEVQYALVKKWGSLTGNIFAIGDPHQAIYGFRGASPVFFGMFPRDFSPVTEITLALNYRSSAAIVESAKAVILRSTGAAVRPVLFTAASEDAAPVRVVTARSEFAEAMFVAGEINRLVGGIDMIDAHRFGNRSCRGEREYGFSDIAVLYRTHRQSEAVERCLVREGIPYRVAGWDGLIGESSAAGLLAVIRFVLNPSDVFSLMAALRYCGESADHALRYAAGRRTIDDLICIIKDAVYEPVRHGKFAAAIDLLRNSPENMPPRETVAGLTKVLGTAGEEPVRRLLHIAEMHGDLRSFVNAVTFGGEADVVRLGNGRPRGDAVLLSTLHAAKGLEFPVTFICGVNDGLLPYRDAGGMATDVDEERRLFYVGITRARERLILTAAERRSFFGEEEMVVVEEEKKEERQCGMSPFIADMDRKYIIYETFLQEPAVKQMSLF